MKFWTLDSEIPGKYYGSVGEKINAQIHQKLTGKESCGFCYYYTVEK